MKEYERLAKVFEMVNKYTELYGMNPREEKIQKIVVELEVCRTLLLDNLPREEALKLFNEFFLISD